VPLLRFRSSSGAALSVAFLVASRVAAAPDDLRISERALGSCLRLRELVRCHSFAVGHGFGQEGQEVEIDAHAYWLVRDCNDHRARRADDERCGVEQEQG
jgi:hypothetical protein